MTAPKLIQFGAGNIGRSFIGPLFARAGYEVVFVDIDEVLVQALNERRRYRVEIKDTPPATLWVENVRAVHGRDTERVVAELASADLAATAVGPAALPSLYGVIAAGLQRRHAQGRGPLDLILCENLRHAAAIVRAGLQEHLPEGFPLDEMVGLVETSIGKMVPLMTAEQRAEDPLWVFAEAYNTLIVDRRGFLCGVPPVPGLEAKENMAAYVDRKLFIHNLGHAVAAYVGYLALPGATYLWEAVEDPRVRAAAAAAMWESGRALIAAYPEEFNEANQREHIDDLLHRFANRALGDTLYRVGRDLPRKLSPQDRLIGALRLQAQQGVDSPYTLLGTAAACLFRAGDENGELFPPDRCFAEEVYPRGLEAVLTEVCGLDARKPADRRLREQIAETHRFLIRQREAGADWLTLYEREHPIRSDPRSVTPGSAEHTSRITPQEQEKEGSMNIPSDLLYYKEHEWVRVEDDDVAVIGISEYAQGQLGDIVYLELPSVGDRIEDREEPFGQIESVKAMSDLFSPVSGTVIRVHKELIDTLTPINEDPYGEGWMIAVKMDDPSQLDELMTASEYERFLEEQG